MFSFFKWTLGDGSAFEDLWCDGGGECLILAVPVNVCVCVCVCVCERERE